MTDWTPDLIARYNHMPAEFFAPYIAGAGSRYPGDALMREVYLRDNGTCQKCLRQAGPRSVHFDHIIPFSQDGETLPWNLQVLCPACNLAKGDRMSAQDHAKLAELNSIQWNLRFTVAAITSSLAPERIVSLDSGQKDALRREIPGMRAALDTIEAELDARERRASRARGAVGSEAP